VNQPPNPPKAGAQAGSPHERSATGAFPAGERAGLASRGVGRATRGPASPLPGPLAASANPPAGGLGDPIRQFTSRRLTRKENLVKRQIDTYHVSEVDDSAVIYLDRKALPVHQSVDLPDAVCEGLCFKQRLVQIRNGDLLLLARWKPDRYMRRSAPEGSQRWFVEKQLFPPDAGRFFSRMEKQAVEPTDEPPPLEEAE